MAGGNRLLNQGIAVRFVPYSMLLAGVFAVLSGCATKGYVNEQTAALSKRTDGDVFRLDTRLSSLDARVGSAESALAGTSKLAQEALDRANAAQRLAEGKLVYEVTLNDDQIKFANGKATLVPAAQAALDELATKLKAENRGTYIEIQGHTDQVGSKAYNKKLGLERAEAVRDHLHNAGIPLHRLNVISYGSSQPVAKGKGREARAQNRRVALLVLA